MNTNTMLEIMSKRDVKKRSSDIAVRSIGSVVTECRKYLQDNYTDYMGKYGEERNSIIQNLISKYIADNQPYVDGYVKDGQTQVNELINRLTQDITDYGILSSAMSDEKVFEIQINGREIKIEKGGRIIDYTDSDGRIISFSSPEEQEVIFKKLLGDVRLTPKDSIVSSRTVEGYRVAAVHSSGIALDTIDKNNNGYGYMVIRKFKKDKLFIGDIVKFKTMSDNMAKFLSTMVDGACTFFTVGPTASGKTTTNQAILATLPDDLRTILVQNPSEIDLNKRDSTGRIVNNTVHFEAKSIENPSSSDPTMENFMNQILRFSPKYIVFGELRSNSEFGKAMTAALAGHAFNCTFHAEDSLGAFNRYLNAYTADSGGDRYAALVNLTSVVNFIIVQRIMKDGTRKILQITEVVGLDYETNTPILNDLYIYDVGDTLYDEDGRVKSITGSHRRVGKLSDRTVNMFKLNGVHKEKYEFLLNNPSESENESYTGDIEI